MNFAGNYIVAAASGVAILGQMQSGIALELNSALCDLPLWAKRQGDCMVRHCLLPGHHKHFCYDCAATTVSSSKRQQAA